MTAPLPLAPGLPWAPILAAAPAVPEGISTRIQSLRERVEELARLSGVAEEPSFDFIGVVNGYVGVLLAAFLVTLCMTPVMRALAVRNGVIDRPSDPRKVHRTPIAYLGGMAVFLGIMAGIAYSYLAVSMPILMTFHQTDFITTGGHPSLVPREVVLGLAIITGIGLWDDVAGLSPRVKVGGQLLAAAALALGNWGVKVAQGVLTPTLGALLDNPDLVYTIALPPGLGIGGEGITIDVIYWAGTALIAVSVLGACNASNLIDGLDGLLSGVTGIATVGLLGIALLIVATDPGERDSQRLVLCLAVLGGCLGFLPHNFNPATIFLGDCGSLLLGFATIVIILSLGDTGRTDLVFAGLIVYAVPIIDTLLAIVRRKMAGKKMSDPDSDHLHHMLKRALGVKGAVFSLYAIGIGFAVLGVAIAASGARIVYTLSLLFGSFIAVYAIKIARRKAIEEHAIALERARGLLPQDPAPAGDAAPNTHAASTTHASNAEPAASQR